MTVTEKRNNTVLVTTGEEEGGMSRKRQTIELDDRIKRVVLAMGRYPGIDTFSSCGGHINPTAGQVSAAECYVSFGVDHFVGGWCSLQRLTAIVADYNATNHQGKFNILTWLSGDSPETMAFLLEGTRGADPNILASLLIFLDPVIFELAGRRGELQHPPMADPPATSQTPETP